MAAEPAIEKRVEKMVSNHRWVPAGYKVCLTSLYDGGGRLTASTGEIRRSFCLVDDWFSAILGFRWSRSALLVVQ